MKPKKCTVCNEAFMPRSNAAKYCDGCRPSIRQNYWKNGYEEKLLAKRTARDRICGLCGSPFEHLKKGDSTKYCSPGCREIARRASQKKAQQTPAYMEKQRKRSSEYALNNVDKVKARRAIYRAAHRDEINRKRRENYYANREKQLARARAYKKANRDKMRPLEQRRRALQANAPGSFTSGEWVTKVEECGNVCFDCGIEFDEAEHRLTVGHAVPLSKGGSNFISNIIPQCLECNLHQHTKIHPNFAAKAA